MISLRQYQTDCIEDLRGGYRGGARRQLFVLPTGGGKTVCFAFITKSAAEKGQRTLILTHRAEILGQISRTLKAVGVLHATLQAGDRTPRMAQTVVASIGTLVRRLDEFPKPSLIIGDEFHHVASASWTKVFAHFSESRILGVTATPERLDGKGLGAYVDRMVRGPEVAWLIEQGFLARPRYFSPERMVDTSSLHRVAGDFNKAESAALVDKPTITGDAVQQYLRHINGKRAVAFCVSIAHAEHVAAQFNAAGIPAATIDGTMSDADRARIIRALDHGDILVMTSCELVSEGFDLPIVDAAILLRPTESLAMHLQQVGRVLRVKPSGGPAYVLDHVGNCLRHGLAEEVRDWSLEGGDGKRRKDEPLTATRRCDVCFAIFVGKECPQCKEPYVPKIREIQQVEGQLKEMTPEEFAARRMRKSEEHACRSFEDFKKLGAIRGYKGGWAWMRWKTSRFNKQPEPVLV